MIAIVMLNYVELVIDYAKLVKGPMRVIVILNCVELVIDYTKLTRGLVRVIMTLNNAEERIVVQLLVLELCLNRLMYMLSFSNF